MANTNYYSHIWQTGSSSCTHRPKAQDSSCFWQTRRVGW